MLPHQVNIKLICIDMILFQPLFKIFWFYVANIFNYILLNEIKSSFERNFEMC